MTFPDPRPYFKELHDPRREGGRKLHRLDDILFIMLVASLCGIEDVASMEEWAYEKEPWLRQHLELPNGIPSHDTMTDVLHRINPKEFCWMLTAWVETALPNLAGEQIAIDGKTLRGSGTAKEAVHIVSAWACRGHIVLAQEIIDEKSNEITAVPPLLSLLEIEGATVTADAMGCQRAIAEVIHASGAGYVLAVKDNQPKLCEDVQSSLDAKVACGALQPLRTLDKDHGRVEVRKYYLSTDLQGIRNAKDWHGLAAIGMVESTREIIGKGLEPSVERRYFISTVTDLPKFAELVRGHWSTENRQHWVLDVQFREDDNTLSKKAAKNLAVIRRMSLNLLRREPNEKRSTKRRKLHAMLDDSYREELLFGSCSQRSDS
jgi:predicted transposase YbfD/YdcC